MCVLSCKKLVLHNACRLVTAISVKKNLEKYILEQCFLEQIYVPAGNLTR
jgi:hypothetical protein